MRQYKHLQMFAHCEKLNNQPLKDHEVSAFIRIGSDFQNNYYEYEVPLTVTDPTRIKGTITASEVWPDSNKFYIPLDLFTKIKQDRDRANVPKENIYSETDNSGETINKVSICGTPVLSNVTAIMIGVRNPSDKNNPYPKKDMLPKIC